MLIGVSTASLYPMHTEDAVRTLAELGVKNLEIFFNARNELEGDIFRDILGTVESYKINVMSAHPFSSPMETLYLFSDYDRRVEELFCLYESYFRSMNVLGADKFVIHGAILSSGIEDGLYIERFGRLSELGRKYNVMVCQENICYCKSKSLDFLVKMKQELGDTVHFVLDLKQARRSGAEAEQIIKSLGKSIVHVHISDANKEQDCLPVGAGEVDFGGILRALRDAGSSATGAIELYRSNYTEYAELLQSARIIDKISQNL